MQLKRLSCNQKTFREINFKPGLNFILAKKSNPQDKDTKITHNGVGKSLIVSLIHFCLASNSNEEFEKKIPNWEFVLEFSVAGENFISKRNTSNQNQIYLNNQLMSLDKFRDLLGEKLFNIDSSIRYLKFRPLMCRFIRPRKKSYYSFDNYEDKEAPIGQLVANSYLLGLDIDYILEKYDSKKELDKIIDLKKNIEKDEIFKNYFSESKDLEINIVDLREKIKKLESELKKFEVAENYHEIKKDADDVSYQIKLIENQIVVLNNSIHNINRSLKLNPDISKEKIIEFYDNAKAELSEKIIKRLEDVERFHSSLLKNREIRLFKEKTDFIKEIEMKDNHRKVLAIKFSELIKYLDSHGALEDYNKMNLRLSDLKNSLEKLTTYNSILEEYKKKAEEWSIKMKQKNIETADYLNYFKKIIEKDVLMFRSFSNEFYSDKPAGIEVINDTGENQNRFKINARIEADASDGINEVKVFCFDLTLLKAHHNHKINFLFHDSRLFSDIEPRQRATLFRLAYKETLNNTIQYIATINADQIEQTKEYYKSGEYEEIFTKNIILELTDESDAYKLLGIKVDMKYEED